MAFQNYQQCDAKSKRSGLRCNNPSVKGSIKCRMHGGKSLKGIASPKFKHGHFSAYLPARLVDIFNSLITSEKLLEMKESIALIDTQICHHLSGLENADAVEEKAIWYRINPLLLNRAKLIEAEAKQMVFHTKYIEVEMVRELITDVTISVKSTISDPAVARAFDMAIRKHIEIKTAAIDS